MRAPRQAECCLTKCSSIPNCDGCVCDDCASPPPPPAKEETCVCLEADSARSALHALRKVRPHRAFAPSGGTSFSRGRCAQYCSSFRPADEALWVPDASMRPFGGHYQIPADFERFCSLHTAFSVEGDSFAPCQLFLQRLVRLTQ